MLAIKKARKRIDDRPMDLSSQILAELVLALETEGSLDFARLYQLEGKHFDLALEILDEWRLDRHYASKKRLVDAARQTRQDAPPDQDADPTAAADAG